MEVQAARTSLALGDRGQTKSGGPNLTQTGSRSRAWPVVRDKGTGAALWSGGAMPTPRRTPSSSNDTFNVLHMYYRNLVIYKIIHILGYFHESHTTNTKCSHYTKYDI